MTANSWLYALACVIFPAAWGLLMVAATNLVQKKLNRRKKDAVGKTADGENGADSVTTVPQPEYYI